MTMTAKIQVTNDDLRAGVQEFLKGVLGLEEIRAVLTPMKLPGNNSVMPTLVTAPERLADADPLAPAFPLNAARMVARLTRKPMGGKIAAVLRPCEIRAFVELVKLKQGNSDDVVLIGIDCPGAFSNLDYIRFSGEDAASTAAFCKAALGDGGNLPEGFALATACQACEHPTPDGADIAIGLFGADIGRHVFAAANTAAGEAVLSALGLETTDAAPDQAAAVEKVVAERIAFRDRVFAETAEAVNGVEKMSAYFANCVNCYNCRVACPVCYCKECVFVTDAFNHEPSQYLKWADRKGAVKLPTDTVFYHLTRLAHMSTACVGCGQCSNACPNDIPVMEVFRMVSHDTQKAFDYVAGQDKDAPPPLSVFRENEFKEVVGIGPVN